MKESNQCKIENVIITKMSSVKRQVRIHHILNKKHKGYCEVYEKKIVIQKTEKKQFNENLSYDGKRKKMPEEMPKRIKRQENRKYSNFEKRSC